MNTLKDKYRLNGLPYTLLKRNEIVALYGIGGTYTDEILQKSVLPFYNMLGTPEKDKHLVVYNTDHYIPKDEMIMEVLNWLDKYFGPVKPLTNK